jgi:hypothetical protein
MARPGASEETRIRKLKDALQRARTTLTPGEMIGQRAMCDLLGVSSMTLREWLDDPEVEGSGAFKRGGMGNKYEFDPVLTIWVLLWYFERKRSDAVLVNARMREMVVGDRLGDAPPEMTMRDVKEAMQVNLQLLTAEKEAGKLVDATEAASTYRNLLLSIRDTLLGSPQRLDPTNAWPTEFRETFDNALSDVLVELRNAAEKALIDLDATLPARPDAPADRSGGRKAAGRRAGTGAKRARATSAA